MGNTDDDFSDDIDNDDDDVVEQESNAAKVLRKQNRALKAQFDAAEAERVKLAKRVRNIDVAELLDKHGASKRLARYVDVDEPTEESVLAWLTENGEDFGWEPEPADDEDGVEQEQAARISRASRNAPDSKNQTITPEFIRTADRATLIRHGIVAG